MFKQAPKFQTLNFRSSVIKHDKPAKFTPQNRNLNNYPALKVKPASMMILGHFDIK